MNNIHHSLQSLAINIDKLSFLEGNPRQGDIEAVAKSYKQFGQRKPIVATTNHVVIAGNHQLAAARQLGWDEIAVVITDDDELTAKAFALADNRTAELGSYDGDLLADLLSEVSSVPELMDSTGFTEDDLFDLIGFDDESEEEEEIEVPLEPKTKLGDMYKLGNHYLLCGDATNEDDVEKLLQNNDIDMIFNDPPYGIKHSGKGITANGVKGNDFGEILNDIDVSVAKTTFNYVFNKWKNKTIIYWGANYYPNVLPDGFGWIVWDKQKEGNTFSGAELAFVNKGIRLDIFRHLWHGMVKGSEHGQKRLHPTQKPIALVEWCIKNYNNPDIVLDMFGGSGSTIIACEKLNKKCFLMELDPKYCDVIIERWENLTGQKAELING